MRWAVVCGAIMAAFILSASGGSSAESPARRLRRRLVALASRPGPFQTVQQGASSVGCLSSVADVPLSREEIDAHFDASFLDKVQCGRESTWSWPNSGHPESILLGLLSSEPRALPSIAITSFGSERWKVTLSVDGSGLIDGLASRLPLPRRRVGLETTRP